MYDKGLGPAQGMEEQRTYTILINILKEEAQHKNQAQQDLLVYKL